MAVKGTEFNCNINNTALPFPHFWEHTVGSGHATLALRADWQQQLTRCRAELGFKHVRFHGLLSNDMGTMEDEMDEYVYSFFNADQIFDFLLSIGMKPFVELSFMPLALSSGGEIVFHYKGNITPPRSYDEWGTLIYKLAQHWADRYGVAEVGQWFFEVWNEPNLSAFWTGSQTDYFRLYQYAALAIKKVAPELQVGGPATASNAWITDFLNFAEQNKVPVDFITTHHYPTDAFGQPGDDTIAQLAKSRRSVLCEQVVQAQKEAKGKPVYYTECATSSNAFDELHDAAYAAAFIIKTVMEAQGCVEGYSYWAFSDIFEENYFSSIPFHGGFGLMNIYGVPKPSYRAFQLLHHLGDEILSVKGKHETVDVWITRKDRTFKILITNWALPEHPVQTETINIRLENITKIKAAYIERIDEDHANATNIWKSMGKPDSLKPAQVAELEQASVMAKEAFPLQQEDNSVFFSVAVPSQGTICVTVEIA